MKKILWIVVIALLIWCSFLTFELNRFKSSSLQTNAFDNINYYTLNGYTSDLTEVISKTLPKVVSVVAINYDWDESVGSGVIVDVEDNNVFIATNYHIIENCDEVKIVFDNLQEKVGEVVGFDNISDVALIKVETDFKVEPFNIGNSSILKTGEYVIGVGTPFHKNFSGSASFGIVSGNDRSFLTDRDSDGNLDSELLFIQTDASINPGNSGGALVNLAGDLVGMTTMRVSDIGYESMNFALSSNELMPIIEELKENSKVSKYIFGVQSTNISEFNNYQKSFNKIALDVIDGVFVSAVFNESPAKEMGIMSGDIIKSINGVEIKTVDDLRKVLYGESSVVDIVIMRELKEINIHGELK
ncbi:MAG: S1C family serine protease [Anaerorhabdus sp.]